MSHHIQAVILKGAADADALRRFDMKTIELPGGLILIPLIEEYCDHWSGALGIEGFVSERPSLNAKVVHRMMEDVAPGAPFAIVETDYFGGMGAQSSAVYQAGAVLLSPQVEDTETGPVARDTLPINRALRILGVQATGGQDEFDTVGLSKWRKFDDLFERYLEP